MPCSFWPIVLEKLSSSALPHAYFDWNGLVAVIALACASEAPTYAFGDSVYVPRTYAHTAALSAFDHLIRSSAPASQPALVAAA